MVRRMTEKDHNIWKNFQKQLRNLHPTLVEIWLGQMIYGFCGGVLLYICYLKGWIMKAASALYNEGVLENFQEYQVFLGFFIGILIAMGMAFHMYLGLTESLLYEEDSSKTYQIKRVLIRAAVILGMLGIILWTNVMDPLVFLLGLFSLKVGAYMQPLTHRLKSQK